MCLLSRYCRCWLFSAHMTRPCHYIATHAKEIDSGETKEHANTGVKEHRRRLAEQFTQCSGCEVRIVVIIDAVVGKPHIIRWQVRTAHDGGNKTFIHEHFIRLNVRIKRAQPAQ